MKKRAPKAVIFTLVGGCFVGIFIGIWGGVFPFWSSYTVEAIPVSKETISAENGYAYVYFLPPALLSDVRIMRPIDPKVRFYEDETLLRRNDNHDDIRKIGGGQFSHWESAIYFASMDSSDPRLNEYAYRIEIPSLWPLSLYKSAVIVLCALLFWGAAFLLADRAFKDSDSGLPFRKERKVALASSLVITTVICWAMLEMEESTYAAHYMLAIAIVLILLSAVEFDEYRSKGNVLGQGELNRTSRKPVVLHIWHKANSSNVVVAMVLVSYTSGLVLGFPSIHIGFDTPSYLRPLFDVFRGEVPQFINRPAGYSLFILAIVGMGGSLDLVVIVQSVLLGLSLCVFAVAMRVLLPQFALFAAVGISIYALSPSVQRYAPQLMSEALYVSMIVIGFGFLILAYQKDKRYFWILASICHGCVMIIKPNGLYLIVIYLIVCFHLWRTTRSRSRLLAYALPLVAVLFAQCSYNYSTIGSFALSAFGEQAMIGTVGTYMATSSDYPSFLSVAIENHMRTIDPADIDLLRNSWDYEELNKVFLKYFKESVRGQESVMKYLLRNGYAEDYMGLRQYLGMIIKDSIRKEPLLYAKLVYSGFMTEMFSYINTYFSHFDVYLKNLEFMNASERRIEIYEAFGDEWTGNVPNGWLYEEDARLLSESIKQVYRPLRKHAEFRGAFFLALVAAAIRLVLSRGYDRLSFLSLVMLLSAVGAALLTGMAQVSLERYAFTHEIFMWIAPALLAGMLVTGIEKRRRKPEVAVRT